MVDTVVGTSTTLLLFDEAALSICPVVVEVTPFAEFCKFAAVASADEVAAMKAALWACDGTREERRFSASSRDRSFVELSRVMSSKICRCWDAVLQVSLRCSSRSVH